LSRGIADVGRVVELVIAGLLFVLYSVLRFQVRTHILQYVIKNKDPPFTTTRLKRWHREERKRSGWAGRSVAGAGRRGLAMSHLFSAQNIVGGLRQWDHGENRYLGWYEKSAGVYSNGSGILSTPSCPSPWTILGSVGHRVRPPVYGRIPSL